MAMPEQMIKDVKAVQESQASSETESEPETQPEEETQPETFEELIRQGLVLDYFYIFLFYF